MSRSIVQVITVVFIDDIPYLHEKPFIWIETEKFHFGFSCVILTEIQISQSTALICCISDVRHPYLSCSLHILWTLQIFYCFRQFCVNSLSNRCCAFGSGTAPGMTAPHVVFVYFARYVYMKSGMNAQNYAICGIISSKSPPEYWTVCLGLTQECKTAPINNCVLIIHDTVCISVKFTNIHTYVTCVADVWHQKYKKWAL